MTPKREIFIRELIKGKSQREAYKKAFSTKNMSDNVIDTEASNLIKDPKVSLRYKELLKKAEDEAIADAVEVLKGYTKLSRFNPRKLFNDDGTPMGIWELDDETAYCISGIEVQETFERVAGEKVFTGYIKKYKVIDKKGALDSLAKYLDLINDNTQVNVNVSNPYQELTTDELKKLISDG